MKLLHLFSVLTKKPSCTLPHLSINQCTSLSFLQLYDPSSMKETQITKQYNTNVLIMQHVNIYKEQKCFLSIVHILYMQQFPGFQICTVPFTSQGNNNTIHDHPCKLNSLFTLHPMCLSRRDYSLFKMCCLQLFPQTFPKAINVCDCQFCHTL